MDESGIMGEEWIKDCNALLGQLKESTKARNPNRLERVRSMHTALHSINHSTRGWLQHANYPEVTSWFNLDELKETHGSLNEIAEKGIQKGLSIFKHDEEPRPYV